MYKYCLSCRYRPLDCLDRATVLLVIGVWSVRCLVLFWISLICPLLIDWFSNQNPLITHPPTTLWCYLYQMTPVLCTSAISSTSFTCSSGSTLVVKILASYSLASHLQRVWVLPRLSSSCRSCSSWVQRGFSFGRFLSVSALFVQVGAAFPVLGSVLAFISFCSG